MSRKGSKENPITQEDLEKLEIPKKPFMITAATIKDGMCHYSYMITDGVNVGDEINCKGSGIIDTDMRQAFAELNVHLACIDDAFKYSKVKIQDIDTMRNHDLALNFSVTQFIVKGKEENLSVILVGSKFVSAGGRIEIKSPKIPLDSASSYKWYNELKRDIERAQEEVEAYKNGKFTPVEEEEKYSQSAMEFNGETSEEFSEAAL